MSWISSVKSLFPSGNRYLQDFQGLVDTVYAAQNGSVAYPLDTYQLALYKKLCTIPRRNTGPLDIEDIQQQLLLIWWEILSRKKTKKQSLRAYLLRLSVLELVYWYHKQVRVVDREENSSQTAEIQAGQKIPWLLENRDRISDFQAYLLFLRFIQNLTIVEIAKALQKDKRTVRALLRQTLIQLKE